MSQTVKEASKTLAETLRKLEEEEEVNRENCLLD